MVLYYSMINNFIYIFVRCGGKAQVQNMTRTAAIRAWDQRWTRACRCGGIWRIHKACWWRPFKNLYYRVNNFNIYAKILIQIIPKSKIISLSEMIYLLNYMWIIFCALAGIIFSYNIINEKIIIFAFFNVNQNRKCKNKVKLIK